jgi:hypothetical protein
MATTKPSRTTSHTERTTRVHHLAATGMSNRAIARELGMHHTTVGRILRTTTAPEPTTPTPAERTTPATSETPRTPWLLRDLEPDLIQDLNILRDPHTGALPAPLRTMLRTAADARRTTILANAQRLADEQEQRTTGRGEGRARA